MKLLRLALDTQNWELAAHIVVYEAAKVLTEGVKPTAQKDDPPGCLQGSTQGQSERS